MSLTVRAERGQFVSAVQLSASRSRVGRAVDFFAAVFVAAVFVAAVSAGVDFCAAVFFVGVVELGVVELGVVERFETDACLVLLVFAVFEAGDSAAAFSLAVSTGLFMSILGADSGAAYVFFREGGVWQQQKKLTALDGEAATVLGTRSTLVAT